MTVNKLINMAAGSTQKAIASGFSSSGTAGFRNLILGKASLDRLSDVARFIGNHEPAKRQVATMNSFIAAVQKSKGSRKMGRFLNKLIDNTNSFTRQVIAKCLSRSGHTGLIKLMATKVSRSRLPKIARIIAEHAPAQLKTGTMDAFLAAIPSRRSFNHVLANTGGKARQVIALTTVKNPPLAHRIGKDASLANQKKLSHALLKLQVPKKEIGLAFQDIFGAARSSRRKNLIKYYRGTSALLRPFLETQLGLGKSRTFLEKICKGQNPANAASIHRELHKLGNLAKTNPAVANPNHLGVWVTKSRSRTNNSSRTLSVSGTVKGGVKASVGVVEKGGELSVTVGGAWTRGKARTRGNSRRVDLGVQQIHGRTMRNRTQSVGFYTLANALDQWARARKSYGFSVRSYNRKKRP